MLNYENMGVELIILLMQHELTRQQGNENDKEVLACYTLMLTQNHKQYGDKRIEK